jgi:hypothetical protein
MFVSRFALPKRETDHSQSVAPPTSECANLMLLSTHPSGLGNVSASSWLNINSGEEVFQRAEEGCGNDPMSAKIKLVADEGGGRRAP